MRKIVELLNRNGSMTSKDVPSALNMDLNPVHHHLRGLKRIGVIEVNGRMDYRVYLKEYLMIDKIVKLLGLGVRGLKN